MGVSARHRLLFESRAKRHYGGQSLSPAATTATSTQVFRKKILAQIQKDILPSTGGEYAPFEFRIHLFGRRSVSRLPKVRRPFSNPNFALRVRELDVVLAEAVPQREIDISGDVPDTVGWILDPEPQ